MGHFGDEALNDAHLDAAPRKPMAVVAAKGFRHRAAQFVAVGILSRISAQVRSRHASLGGASVGLRDLDAKSLRGIA
jgi:hypothetical protein